MQISKELRNRIGIYEIFCIGNKKSYVGSTSRSFRHRAEIHFRQLRNNEHHSIKLQRAWNFYGEEAFEFNVLETVDDKKTLVEKEQSWIDKFDSYKNGLNSKPFANSSIGYKFTEEQKRNVSNGLKEAYKKGLQNHQKGKPLSNEQKEKLSKARIGKYCGEKCPKSKLTNENVLEIRASYSRYGHPNRRELGVRFGVQKSTIDKILEGKAWSHIK